MLRDPAPRRRNQSPDAGRPRRGRQDQARALTRPQRRHGVSRRRLLGRALRTGSFRRRRPAVARALDVTPETGETAEDALRRHLAARRMLLVLDNFEHLLDASPSVANLLRACRALVVLATSREPLNIAAEQRYTVDVLEVPAQPERATVAEVESTPATAMFLTPSDGATLGSRSPHAPHRRLPVSARGSMGYRSRSNSPQRIVRCSASKSWQRGSRWRPVIWHRTAGRSDTSADAARDARVELPAPG